MSGASDTPAAAQAATEQAATAVAGAAQSTDAAATAAASGEGKQWTKLQAALDKQTETLTGVAATLASLSARFPESTTQPQSQAGAGAEQSATEAQSTSAAIVTVPGEQPPPKRRKMLAPRRKGLALRRTK